MGDNIIMFYQFITMNICYVRMYVISISNRSLGYAVYLYCIVQHLFKFI